MYKVTWQYGREVMGPLESVLVPSRPIPIDRIEAAYDGLAVVSLPEPVFTRPSVALRSLLLEGAPELRDDSENDLASYHHMFVATREDARLLAERIGNLAGVAYVDIQGRPTMPRMIDVHRRSRIKVHDLLSAPLSLKRTRTADFTSRQGYLDPAPHGVDAKHAWTEPGGRGEGVTIIDIESGWNFTHEDLLRRQVGVLDGHNDGSDHGTAVLGIYSGDENGFGITGITPRAIAGAISATYDWVQEKWNAADAIRKAADRLRPGDVILLEMHAPGPNQTGQGQEGFIAIEYWRAEFVAIRYAVSRGIHVVEAGGNGGENLDAPVYAGSFDRDRRDSGAIVVGGGSSSYQPDPRSRIWWSNYGSRVDVQGWGEDIVTSGGRDDPSYHDLVDHPEPRYCYTQSFGGTSGASPIVVGAVAATSGWLRANGRATLSPARMRELLVESGTPQTDGADGPATERIGPLPNIKEMLSTLAREHHPG